MFATTDQPTNPANVSHSSDSVFFSRLALFITIVIFGGFGLNWFSNPEQLGRITVWTGMHGAFSAAWYILLLVQLRLARNGNMTTHKRLGKMSVALVVAILITGSVMVFDMYERLVSFGMFDPNVAEGRLRAGGFLGGNFLQWAIFLAVYVLGLLFIKSPTHHKRFMIASAIQMMPEGLNRFIHLVGLPGYSMLVVIFFVYLAIFVYDWKSSGRIQWSTLVSFGFFVVLATSIYTVFRMQAWGDWVVNLVA